MKDSLVLIMMHLRYLRFRDEGNDFETIHDDEATWPA